MNARRARMRGAATVLALLVGVSALAGCTAAGDEPADEGSQNTSPLPTETVPAPDGGSIDEVVPDASPGATQEASIDEPAELSDGVVLEIADVQKLDVKAETPGEIAGPAVAITLDVRNDSDKSIDVSTAMVSVTAESGAYGQPTTSEPYAPLSGELAAGDSASGVYVFLLPKEERSGLTVTVEYVAGAPVALFVE